MPIDARLRRLERRLALTRVPDDDGEADYVNPLSPEQQARLEELEAQMHRQRLTGVLGREPSEEELAEALAAERARFEAMVAADAKRRAEMGMPPAPKRMGAEASLRLDRLLERELGSPVMPWSLDAEGKA